MKNLKNMSFRTPLDIKAINTENKIRKITGDPKRTTYAGIKVPEDLLE